MRRVEAAPERMRWIESRSRALLVLLAILLAQFAVAQRIEQLKPTNYLNDFAGVVDSTSAQKINALCAELEQKTHAQVAVVTIRNLQGSDAPDYANRLFKQWGVGDRQKDRGVLVLLATEDRKYWTEVGYGLEPILPDGKVGGFGREMVPYLRESRYGDALLLITTRIAQTIAADAGVQVTGVPAQSTEPEPSSDTGTSISSVLPFLLLFFFVILPVLSMMTRRRSRYGYNRGGCSGCLFPFFLGGFGGGGYGGGWGGSGGWGGFGGGSSGGGGFGGFGGGSSGGGGAGGSW